MQRILTFSIITSLTLFLSCTNKIQKQSSAANAPTEVLIQNQVITGVVQLGPVSDSTVMVLLIEPNGAFSTLGETVTNADGKFSLAVSAPAGSALLVQNYGGFFTDEATGGKVTLHRTDSLSSIVMMDSSKNEIQAAVTPITHLIAERTMNLNKSGKKEDFSNAKATAETEIAALFGAQVEDLRSIPSDPKNPGNASDPEARHAFYLAVISQKQLSDGISAKDGISPVNGIKLLAQDIKTDGEVNFDKGWSSGMKTAAINAANAKPSANFSGFKNLAENLNFGNVEAVEPVEIEEPIPAAQADQPVPGAGLAANLVAPAGACVPAANPNPPLFPFGPPQLPTGFLSCSAAGTATCPAPCGGTNSNPVSSCSAWDAVAACMQKECASGCDSNKDGVMGDACMPVLTGDQVSCAIPCGGPNSGSYPKGSWICPAPLPTPTGTPLVSCSGLPTSGPAICNMACGLGFSCQPTAMPCSNGPGQPNGTFQGGSCQAINPGNPGNPGVTPMPVPPDPGNPGNPGVTPMPVPPDPGNPGNPGVTPMPVPPDPGNPLPPINPPLPPTPTLPDGSQCTGGSECQSGSCKPVGINTGGVTCATTTCFCKAACTGFFCP